MLLLLWRGNRAPAADNAWMLSERTPDAKLQVEASRKLAASAPTPTRASVAPSQPPRARQNARASPQGRRGRHLEVRPPWSQHPQHARTNRNPSTVWASAFTPSLRRSTSRGGWPGHTYHHERFCGAGADRIVERTTAGLAVAQNNRHGRHPCKADTTPVKRPSTSRQRAWPCPGTPRCSTSPATIYRYFSEEYTSSACKGITRESKLVPCSMFDKEETTLSITTTALWICMPMCRSFWPRINLSSV